jgi:hypothetical protein
MMTRITLIAAVSLLFGCHAKEVTREAPFVNEIPTGDKFEIMLPENHAMGETWNLEISDPDRIKLLRNAWRGNERGIVYLFRALGQGTCNLTFIRRSYSEVSGKKGFIVKMKD